MRPTFMGFEAAKSAVFANQKAIDIAGNNWANVNTNGYTRQRVDRSAVSPSSYSTRVASSRTALLGQGVEATGVSQMRDSFLDKRFRDEYSKASYHGQASSILSDIQTALIDSNDITDESGLYGAMQKIYAAINNYSPEANTETQANLVMSAFKNISQVLQQMDANLTNVANQHIIDTQVTVDRTNEILQQVAHLNKMISQDATVQGNPNNEHYRPNELLDQRNLLLDELGSYGDIAVEELPNGMVNVKMGGHAVVTGGDYDTMVLSRNSEGTRDQTLALRWRADGSNVKLEGGTLKASLEYINGRGPNVQSNTETPSQGILYYRDRLDTFAFSLAQMVNNSIPEMDPVTKEPKIDPDTGNIVYKKLLAAKTDSGSTSNSAPVNASNIFISDDWSKNGADFFIYNKETGEAKYAQRIAILLTESSYTFETNNQKFTGSFKDYVVDMSGKLGSDVAFNDGRQESYGMIADDFQTKRDAVSGVNGDEETADMLKYQKSYEAAARLMTTLDDLLDIVINRMGRVGL